MERADGMGHAENFAPVRVERAPVGEIADVRVTAIDGETLIGVKA